MLCGEKEQLKQTNCDFVTKRPPGIFVAAKSSV